MIRWTRLNLWLAAGAGAGILGAVAAAVWPRRGGLAEPLGGQSPASPSRGWVRIPHGPSTRGATRDDWMRDRLALLRVQLGPLVAPALIETIAHLLLAQMWRETGRQNEYWYNVGNLRAFPSVWHRPYWTILDLDGHPGFRAYPSLAEGVADYVHLVSHGAYSAAWQYLLAHPSDSAEWYRQLTTAGYSVLDDSALTEIVSLRARVDQWVAVHWQT